MILKIKSKLAQYWLLIAFVLVGGFLRFYNLNWDQGHFFHPDERNIANAVTKIRFFDQLNPEFFAYGSLPIYFYRAIGELLVEVTGNPNWTREWPLINLIGRSASAFFSTLTIPFIFLIGQKLWNRKTGLLAAFLATFTVSFVQTAHYGVTESMLTFWLVVLTYLSLKITEKSSIKLYLLAGLVLGLALATKVSAISFIMLPLFAHLLYHFKNLKAHLKLLVLPALAFLIFTISSPYVFLNFPKFQESMIYETGVASGKLKVVYVLQFENTFPYLFQIKNFFWQLGPLALISILSFCLLILLALKRKNRRLFLFLLFPIVYFAYFGSWHTKFIRYSVPLLPYLILASAWLMVKWQERKRTLGFAVNSLFIGLTVIWCLAFFSIYLREQTRTVASKWIYTHIPPQSKVLTEHWDDGLPIDLYPKFSPSIYQSEQLTIYEPDNQQKIKYYTQKLATADYIVINSRRLYGTLLYLPQKYPVTSNYYRLLFAEKLGYRKIAEFASYPQFLGLTINDDQSEETFQVYDHPKVLIYKNEKRLSEKELQFLLTQ